MARFLFLNCLFIFSCQHSLKFREPSLVKAQFQQESLDSGLILYLDADLKNRCSASYVSLSELPNRRIFITAAHCLKFSESGDGAGLPLFRSVLDSAGTPKLREVARVKRLVHHPDFQFKGSNQLNPYDIAVGVTEANLPDDMVPLELAPAGWHPKKSGAEKYFFIAGGLSSETLQTENSESVQVRAGEYFSEIRILRDSTLKSLADFAFDSDLKPADILTMSARDDRDPLVCPGDSGGALIERKDNHRFLTGVLFSGGTRNFGNGPQCWWYPIKAIPVSPYLEWLRSNIRQML